MFTTHKTIYRLASQLCTFLMTLSSSVSCARSNFTSIISFFRLLAVQPLVAVAGRSFKHILITYTHTDHIPVPHLTILEKTIPRQGRTPQSKWSHTVSCSWLALPPPCL